MADPLSEIISLLQPHAPYSKLAEARGAFRILREDVRELFYGMVLTGRARLDVSGRPAIALGPGDFVLIPAMSAFSFSSLDPPAPPGLVSHPVMGEDGIVRFGQGEGPPNSQQLVGYCSFRSPDAELLLSLLPDIVVVRGEERLGSLAGLLRDETRADRPARDVVVEHLLQLLLIEAFRSGAAPGETSGLLRGLNDARIAPSLRAMHAEPARPWSIDALATTARLSRSAYFSRFSRIVGVPPLGYLLNWRMTLAKHMLRSGRGVGDVWRSVGYGSVSAFSTAFTRRVGQPPAHYARAAAKA
jgi:AraC-like DNA-binding protein